MMTISMFRKCPDCGQKLMTMEAFNAKDRLSDDEKDLPFICLCKATDGDNDAEDAIKEQEGIKACNLGKIRKRERRSQIPHCGSSLNLGTYSPQNAAQDHALQLASRLAKSYIGKNRNEKGLFVIGGVGTGKSHLVEAMARTMVNENMLVTWRNLGDMLLEFRECFKNKSQITERELIAKYAHTPVLVLDDLGKEKMTEWAQALLFSILNKRYDWGCPTIITSNYGRANLIARLTPKEEGDEVTAAAIVDRIVGGSYTFVLDGDSLREPTIERRAT